jgi:transposase-like protein
MKKQRKHYTPEEKVAVLRRHLLDKEPISKLCDELGLQPTVFYRWQKEFFESGAAAFEQKRPANHSAEQERIAYLAKKIQTKDEVLAGLMAEHVALKKRDCQHLRQQLLYISILRDLLLRLLPSRSRTSLSVERFAEFPASSPRFGLSRLRRYSLRTPRLAPVVDAPVIRARFLRQSLVPPLAPFLGSSALRSSRITFLATTTSPPIASGRSPQAAWLYHMRLDDFWASLFSASLPPASGLTASSCSYGREFASASFSFASRLRLAVRLQVAVIGPDRLLSSN